MAMASIPFLCSSSTAVSFNEGKVTLKVPAVLADKVRPYDGKPISWGVRPEDIYVKGFGSPEGEGSADMQSKVEIVEPMGAEIYTYLTTGKTPFIARLDAHVPITLDETKDLVVDMLKTHFFDASTEAVIA